MALFQKGTQDVVYSIQEGWTFRAMRVFIWMAATVAVFAFYGWTQFRGLKDAEAMEYAQLGRHIAQGEGFTTHCIRPADLWYVGQRNHRLDQFPDIRHAPLYPAVLAAGFRIVRPSFVIQPRAFFYGPEIKVVLPVGILFSLATGLVIFLLGRRLFGARVGFVSMLVFLLSDAVLADSISGTPIPMLTFLVTAACYAAIASALRLAEGRTVLAWGTPLVVSAVLCGLAFLTGYPAVVLVPALAFFVGAGREQGRASAVLVFLLVFVLVVSPWLVRNKTVSGGFLGLAPYAALNHTSLYDGHAFDEDPKPTLHNVKVARALKAKVISNLGRLWDRDLRTVGSGLVICFFLVSFFHRFEQETPARFRWCLALGVVLMFLVAALMGGDSGRLLGVFLPVMIVYGVVFLFIVVEHAEFFEANWDAVLAGVLVVLTALPAALKLMGSPPPRPYPPYYPPFQAYIGSLVEPSEVLCTDIPWATAWYGRCASLLRPASVDDMRALGEKAKLAGVYLTTETGNQPYTDALMSGAYRSWLPILNRKVPTDFPFTNGVSLPSGGVDQIFLTDRVRWKEDASEGK